MKHLFYAITVMPILYEMYCIYNPKHVWLFINGIKLKRNQKIDKFSDTEKIFTFLTLGYFIFLIFGLTSFQWPVYGLIILMGLIPKKWPALIFIDSTITLSLLFFTIMNAYHFHINVAQYIYDL